MGDVTRLLLLLWAAVTVSSAVDLQKRIIGGGPCGNYHLYHVKFTDENGNLICGGSLINNQWILTAAHCLKWHMRAHIDVHPGLGHIEVIRDPPELFIDNNNRVHDIMLLRLPRPLQGQGQRVLPNIQDCAHKPVPGERVWIAGFGPTGVCTATHSIDDDEPAHLRCANIPVVDCQNYRTLIQGTHFYQAHGHNHWICAQFPTVDTAPGDSGGGVEYNGRIYGVISGGGKLAFIQSIFIDVCQYIGWIRQTAGIP